MFKPRSSATVSIVGDAINDWRGLRRLIFGSWINILLICVPLGVCSYYLDWRPEMIFAFNFLGMIPLAAILGQSTEVCAAHLGEIAGGLLNATFGNAVEIVVMAMALIKAGGATGQKRDNLLTLVQTSLIGSVFSNSLLVLGAAFLAHGVKHKEGHFNKDCVTANLTLMLVASFVMVLPQPFVDDGRTEEALFVSRIASVILMAMYMCLLYFELFTHRDLMDHSVGHEQQQGLLGPESPKEAEDGIVARVGSEEDDEEDELVLSMPAAVVTLLVSTLALSFLSDYLVDAIEPVADQLGISEAFIGIILIPIVGNAVEQATAIRMAMKNKMDIALSIAIGSATQVSMFAISLAVLVAWAMDLNLTLAFDQFEQQMFMYSTIIIFAMINDGKSNWLRGALLLLIYVLVAVAVYNQNYTYHA